VIWNVIGKAAGRKLLYSFRERHKELKDEELIEVLCNFFTRLGWGKVSVSELNPAKGEVTIKIINNPFTRENPSKSICHLMRGFIAGICEAIFQRPVDCTESQCASTGSPHCEFYVTRQSGRVKRHKTSSKTYEKA
jgi:predicted hydrocarbon binding protein